jgi:ATP-binding cassette subfamily F protein uup
MPTPLISCQKITKTFGLTPVFEALEFVLQDHDRVGIIGPNGAGKSTLLKILASLEEPDQGIVTAKRGLKIAYVTQADSFSEGYTVREILGQAMGPVQHASDLGRIESLIGKAQFPNPEALAASLSGGWKKRLAICVALVKEPELLLLDEPTNHLDIEGIDWLEDLLANASFTYAVITHDRYFLESSCRTIVEINRIYPGGNFIVNGGYGEYMRRKAEFLEGQSSQMASMANRLRRETEWLQRGAQARSTKQQARIKSAEVLKTDLESAHNRSRKDAVSFSFSASHRKTRKLIEVKAIAKSFSSKRLFADLSFILGPGMRLGLVGPNGSGKSTLLKILQRHSQPDAGHVEHADQLRIVYYDQHREDLPEGKSLRRALAEAGDVVKIQDRSVHVATYAKQFGFKVEQLETAVERLSGGERARLLLARMLQRPADILILDEPTNDLDIDTLEVLEESLLSFPGAIILVTHDRYLMDRVATGILGLHGLGRHDFYADYAQYATDRRHQNMTQAAKLADFVTPDHSKPADTVATTKTSFTHAKRPSNRKLSYMEQREWDAMENNILVAEATLAAARAKTQDPSIASSAAALQEACIAAETAQEKVDTLYARWAELEAKLKD